MATWFFTSHLNIKCNSDNIVNMQKQLEQYSIMKGLNYAILFNFI